MSDVVVTLRDPLPPHAPRAMFLPGQVRYGFMLREQSSVSLQVSRADILQPETYAHGMAISITRTDGALPWEGFIVDRELDDESGIADLLLKDHGSALLAHARTARTWSEQKGSTGSVLRRVLGEADQRAEPPLLLEYPTIHGPDIIITPNAETIADFLDTLVEYSDWEWAIRHQADDHGRRAVLVLQRRIGNDRRGQLTFYQGFHFKSARLSQRAQGYIAAALTVGGPGVFGDRAAASVSTSGFAAEATPTQQFGALNETAGSPIFGGTDVRVEPQVTNQAALTAAARRAHNAPENVREAVNFTLWDGQNADGLSPFPIDLLELGSRYHIVFANLALGLGVERDIRVLALSLDNAGSIEVVAEIERAAA